MVTTYVFVQRKIEDVRRKKGKQNLRVLLKININKSFNYYC